MHSGAVHLIIMELGRFLSALISGTVRRVRRKRGRNVEALSGGCLRLGFPAKACEMKVLRQLAIRCYRTPFLFYGGKRSRLRNSQLIPLFFCFVLFLFFLDWILANSFVTQLLLGRWCDGFFAIVIAQCRRLWVI